MQVLGSFPKLGAKETHTPMRKEGGEKANYVLTVRTVRLSLRRPAAEHKQL